MVCLCRLALVLFLFVGFASAAGLGVPPTNRGHIVHEGKIDVLYLSGSYAQMGGQYGRLEKKRLQLPPLVKIVNDMILCAVMVCNGSPQEFKINLSRKLMVLSM